MQKLLHKIPKNQSQIRFQFRESKSITLLSCWHSSLLLSPVVTSSAAGMRGGGIQRTRAVHGLFILFRRDCGRMESCWNRRISSHMYSLCSRAGWDSGWAATGVSELMCSCDMCSAIFSSVMCCFTAGGLKCHRSINLCTISNKYHLANEFTKIKKIKFSYDETALGTLKI